MGAIDSPKTRGILCIVASAFGFALMAFFVRLCDDFGGRVSCFQKGFFRNVVALGIAVVVFARCMRGNQVRFPPKAAYPTLFLRCLFGAFGIFANFYAISHIQVGEAMALNKTAPFFTVLFSWLLQSFGLVRSNTLKEFVYRRPSWYAMRNVYSLINCETKPVSVETNGGLTCATFMRKGLPLRFYWLSNATPSSDLAFSRVRLADMPKDPVWVDMITGRIFELKSNEVPMWDSPILIAPKTALGVVAKGKSK